MPTINEYVDQLKSDRTDLVDNLETKGISGLSGDETFTELVPRVLEIAGGGQIIQYDTVPTASIDYVGKIIQYTGTTDSNYTNGYFYKCVEESGSYSWVQIDVQESNEGQIIQLDTMPIASSEYADRIIQYIGTTTIDYTNGYFYKCQGDGTAIPQYNWVRIDVQPIIPPESFTYTGSTMTINNLIGNLALKAGEISALTINNTTASDLETIIYFTSGTTATTVSIPVIITNLGDAPTFTVSGGKNTGTCEASKHYIISVINNIAVWKAY